MLKPRTHTMLFKGMAFLLSFLAFLYYANAQLIEQTGKNLLVIPQSGQSNHNSTHLQPADGILCIATGETGNPNNVMAAADTTLPFTVACFAGIDRNGYYELNWLAVAEQNLKQYEIEYGYNGIDFEHAGVVAATNKSTYTFEHITIPVKTIYYRLRLIDLDGSAHYSRSIIINTGNIVEGNFVIPSVIRDENLMVNLDGTYSSLQVLNPRGQEVFRQGISGMTGRSGIVFPNTLPNGAYFVVLQRKDGRLTQKIFVQRQ